MHKLTEAQLNEVTDLKAENTTIEDTFSAWRKLCDALKKTDPSLRRGDLVIAVSRLMYLAGFRDGLECLNEGIEEEITLPELFGEA